jgi:hypothetical protein
MKKFLFFIIFTVVSVGFSGEMKAQSARTIAGQKTDDGVLVAYPNPTKDVLILKSKDDSAKIRIVTFSQFWELRLLNIQLTATAPS